MRKEYENYFVEKWKEDEKFLKEVFEFLMEFVEKEELKKRK